MTAVEALARRVDAIKADHISGATALARQAVDVLDDASRIGASVLVTTARGLCRAQPAMAPLWNAIALTLAPEGPASLRRLREQLNRAPEGLSKMCMRMLLSKRVAGSPGTLSLATVSASGSVRACLAALAAVADVRVVCAEARPAYEGRDMARALVASGSSVTLCTDAAVGAVLEETKPAVEAVLVGADAITPSWFLNKCGTHAVAVAAAAKGIPVYVVAGKATFINPVLATALGNAHGPAQEVWDHATLGLDIANPYFERVPTEVVSMFVTEMGPIGVASVSDLCETLVDSEAASRVLRMMTLTA